jgi:hypothetical protein
VAKKVKKRVRREYTKAEEKELRAHSKARTPVKKIARLNAPKPHCARRPAAWVCGSAISGKPPRYLII